jgi:urease accessory protein
MTPPTRIVVERSGDRHRVTLRPSLLRGQLTRNTPSGCRVGLLATTALLLGGDEVAVEVVVGPGASLELFDVAGTVAYHGRGRPAFWRVAIEVAAGGSVVWAGQPFVVSDGAEVTRVLEADLATTARLALRETLVLGRTGERGGCLLNRTALRVDGAPILLEDQLLDPAGIRDLPGMLGGHRVVDSVITIGEVPPGPPAATRFTLAGGHGAVTRYLGRELADSPLQ